MKLKHAVGLGALMIALSACSSWKPWAKEAEAPAVSPLSLAPQRLNRFADVTIPAREGDTPAFEDATLDALRARTLTQFDNEEEFLTWLKLTREAARERGVYSWRDMPAAEAAVMPGMMRIGMPAASSASISSPIRPKIAGSPPLRRTTR